MARRMAAEGLVTVSLRKSTMSVFINLIAPFDFVRCQRSVVRCQWSVAEIGFSSVHRCQTLVILSEGSLHFPLIPKFPTNCGDPSPRSG
jgi:hypothetical protein